MTFELIEKTQQQIEKEHAEDRFYAKLVKGDPKEVCPMAVKLKNGQVRDVWDFDEDSIVNLMNACLTEFNSGVRDSVRMPAAFKIIECWQQKHEKVSADMIEKMFALEDKFPKIVSVVKDFTTPIGLKQKNDAMTIASYLNGMQGDKTKITHANIVKILKNQEMIQENRKAKGLKA